MAKGEQVDIDYVVSFCEALADEHKMGAIREDQEAFASVKDKRKRDSHIAKSTMADEIAGHFRHLSSDRVKPSAEVDQLARQIDPDTFGRHESMVRRLVSEGADESYALRVADETYGELLADAREKATQSIQTEIAMPADTMQDFASGINAVVTWHEQRALISETAASNEKVEKRKAKFLARAQRHRLYAKHIRQEFESQIAQRSTPRDRMKDASQPDLPFSSPARGPKPEDEGVPIEIQRAFMKRSEVFDDEGQN